MASMVDWSRVDKFGRMDIAQRFQRWMHGVTLAERWPAKYAGVKGGDLSSANGRIDQVLTCSTFAISIHWIGMLCHSNSAVVPIRKLPEEGRHKHESCPD
jgi:hypothetical protein